MEDYSRVRYQVKGKIGWFSERVCQGLSRQQQKFVQQMIYGIVSRKTVRNLKDLLKQKKPHQKGVVYVAPTGIEPVSKV